LNASRKKKEKKGRVLAFSAMTRVKTGGAGCVGQNNVLHREKKDEGGGGGKKDISWNSCQRKRGKNSRMFVTLTEDAP